MAVLESLVFPFPCDIPSAAGVFKIKVYVYRRSFFGDGDCISYTSQDGSADGKLMFVSLGIVVFHFFGHLPDSKTCFGI